MSMIEKIKNSLLGKKGDGGEIKESSSYLTSREIRAIAKQNAQVMRRLEAYKKRKKKPKQEAAQ